MASSKTGPHRPLNIRMIQNFHLVWLDTSVDEENDDDCRNSIVKLRQVVNTVHTFINVDECIDFITDMNKEMAAIIVSGEIIQTVVPIVQEIPQVNSIYIYCENETQPAKWASDCFKVKGVFSDITTICEALKRAVQEYDHNSISISFIKAADTILKQNLDTLDQSAMYTQILKEILITIDFDQSHINDFLSYCRTELAGNTTELRNIEKLRKEYHDHQPIWWYTCQSFLYGMLNRALRLMEIDSILLMGFYIRDLHNQIAALHAEQFGGSNHSNSFTVYRGQGLSRTDFDQLKNTQDGLLAFNNFLSTSKDNNISLRFARGAVVSSDLIGVLFVMKIDPSISATPFANVADVGYYQAREEEILFSIHSVFRIGQVQQIEGNNRIYQVNLTLTSDKDPQLHALKKSMQEETSGSTGWLRLGKLLIKLGYYNKAEELYKILLKQTNNVSEKGLLYHQLGWVNGDQGKYAEAVAIYKKALEILEKTLPANHPDLATSYNNIGSVYHNMGDFPRSFSYYEKALEIEQKILPSNHPHLATFYDNIGGAYENMGEYSKALSYFEKALEMRQKSLPSNHPSLATSYNNIGLVHITLGNYSEALSYYAKDLEISRSTLPADHPDLANSYNNIGSLYQHLGEYSKALSFHENALEIRQKTLPSNHPDLATSYNNIGSVHYNIGQNWKAISYLEKALDISEKTLATDAPNLATFYENIASVYGNMGQYSKALSYFEKALNIQQKNPS